MSRLEQAFADGPAFIPYLVAGDPGPTETATFVETLAEAGASAIELGLPFSEPVAEGPTIQRGITRSLDAGMTPPAYFDLVESLSVDIPLICMTYYNLIYRFKDGAGPPAFIERCVEAGIDGVIVPDLPVEESNTLADACETHDVDLIFIVAPTTTDHRLERIRQRGAGFVYVQARMGTTGASDQVAAVTRQSIARVADWDRPVAVGFGISTGEQARTVIDAGADGAIVGSALVDIIEAGIEADAPTDQTASALGELANELVVGIARTELDLAPAVLDLLDDVRSRSPPSTAVSVTSRGFARAIETRRDAGGIPIIAELKRTSPTTENLRTDDAVSIATEMVSAGASAISVLTEPIHFGGSSEDLERVRAAVDVPVLRKDFILDETELDRVGADAVLLIARFIEDLPGLVSAARQRGMEPLVEVHTQDGLERALAAGANLIGINNRDLGTLSVDLSTVERLAPTIPDDVTVIAESGMGSVDDIDRMLSAGADGLLIGSAIMAGPVGQNLERLLRKDPTTADQEVME